MIVPPGSTIGIVGGGQLGRMLALAAAQLGYRCHIYCPEATSPAGEVSAAVTRGEYDDADALGRFAGAVDVVTYEFENIAAEPLHALGSKAPLYPPPRALEIAQDRLQEKQFIAGLDGRPAPFAAVADLAELEAALATIGTPAILKTRRFGYDGKGQARIMAPGDAAEAWASMRGAPSILEGFVRFEAEFSILLCRSPSGEIAFWNSPRNTHRDGILHRSEIPGGEAIGSAVGEARYLARQAAEALDYIGVLAMEFFATAGGAVFNEMAPRVHNSGHWTIEGALTSQFENHIRAICELPLGATDLVVPKVTMENLIGGDVERWRDLFADRTAHLHLYGKNEARPGRKMGHVTWLG